jgi:uncharacterized membrane protein YeaQ/YmgE (transglycosylase-associated protein family)
MMSLLGTIFVGLIVGLIARALKPGDDSMGWIMTIVLGIIGSLLAGFAGSAMGLYPEGSSAGWIASIIGAVVVLFIYNMVRGKRQP